MPALARRLRATVNLWALLLILLVACGSEPDPPSLLPATATSRPTPTLAGASANPEIPTPAVTRQSPALPERVETPGSPTAAPSPSPTPDPATRLGLGDTALAYQDYAAAIEHFRVFLEGADEPGVDDRAVALFGLAEAYYGAGQLEAAAAAFNRYLAFRADASPTDGNRQLRALYRLADLNVDQGNCRAAIGYYEDVLTLSPGLAAYVRPRQATCHLLLGDRVAALTAYQAGVAAPAHPLQIIALHQVLAAWAFEDAAYDTAIFHYEKIEVLAESPLTKAQAIVAAGNAAIQAGNLDDAYDRYRFAVTEYPEAYDSYQALIALVGADIAVDEYQRGLVDYYAGAYFPCIEALSRYLELAGVEGRLEASLYLGWCYEAVGDLISAEQQLAAFAERVPAQGLLEQGRLSERSGDVESAVARYRAYVETYPLEADAPATAWRVASLHERMGQMDEAVSAYRALAETFPTSSDAAEALFRAGWITWNAGDSEAAWVDWEAGASYVDQAYGAASLLWLARTSPEGSDEAEAATVAALDASGDSYYAFRAREASRGQTPFTPLPGLNLSVDEAAERAEAEAWLAEQWGQAAALTPLPATLAQDGRLQRGKVLWQLGFYREADRELNGLREDVAADPIASYQLALAFRDAGMYRESILAAAAVRNQAGADTLTVPTHLARLLYPVYYADLILPLAVQYGYDPLLQFSLVRQESLFNSFATSSAAAQGLSQVIPDTGLYIADRLGWPDFENEDLYRPVVGLAFGAYYLQEQLARFDGDVYAALSAYNAGPGNAARWIAEVPDDPDLYVEIIDFSETRLYVERIYAGYAIYQILYGADAP